MSNTPEIGPQAFEKTHTILTQHIQTMGVGHGHDSMTIPLKGQIQEKECIRFLTKERMTKATFINTESFAMFYRIQTCRIPRV